MRSLFEWLVDQRGGVAIGLAVTVLAVTLALRFWFHMWWPAGIALATVFGVVGLFAGKRQ